MPTNLDYLQGFFDDLGEDDQGRNKRSQWIWQRYASPVWDDIRQTKVLPFKDGREVDDQRHICPLQLDVIERCMQLWSSEGDTFLTPFMHATKSSVECTVQRHTCFYQTK